MNVSKSQNYLGGLLCGLILGTSPLSTLGHGHVVGGAVSPEPGSDLRFKNADAFAAESGYVEPLFTRTQGPAKGYFETSALTFTAGAIDPLYGGPETGHAGLGTQLAMQIVSVEGPDGASFGFWESPDCDTEAESLTFSSQVGVTEPTPPILLSQNEGEPDADPYGHCHGRRYTATHPGLYTVGFRLLDLSHNGPAGGPVHPPSAVFRMHFQAGVTVAEVRSQEGALCVRFAARLGGTYYVEKTGRLGEGTAGWDRVAGPIRGRNRIEEVVVPQSTTEPIYVRLHATLP